MNRLRASRPAVKCGCHVVRCRTCLACSRCGCDHDGLSVEEKIGRGKGRPRKKQRREFDSHRTLLGTTKPPTNPPLPSHGREDGTVSVRNFRVREPLEKYPCTVREILGAGGEAACALEFTEYCPITERAGCGLGRTDIYDEEPNKALWCEMVGCLEEQIKLYRHIGEDDRVSEVEAVISQISSKYTQWLQLDVPRRGGGAIFRFFASLRRSTHYMHQVPEIADLHSEVLEYFRRVNQALICGANSLHKLIINLVCGSLYSSGNEFNRAVVLQRWRTEINSFTGHVWTKRELDVLVEAVDSQIKGRTVTIDEIRAACSCHGLQGGDAVADNIACEVVLRGKARFALDAFGCYNDRGDLCDDGTTIIVPDGIQWDDIMCRYDGWYILNGRFYVTDGYQGRPIVSFVMFNRTSQPILGRAEVIRRGTVICRSYYKPFNRLKDKIDISTAAEGMRICRQLADAALGRTHVQDEMLKRVLDMARGVGEANNLSISDYVTKFPGISKVTSISGRRFLVGIEVNRALRRARDWSERMRCVARAIRMRLRIETLGMGRTLVLPSQAGAVDKDSILMLKLVVRRAVDGKYNIFYQVKSNGQVRELSDLGKCIGYVIRYASVPSVSWADRVLCEYFGSLHRLIWLSIIGAARPEERHWYKGVLEQCTQYAVCAVGRPVGRADGSKSGYCVGKLIQNSVEDSLGASQNTDRGSECPCGSQSCAIWKRTERCLQGLAECPICQLGAIGPGTGTGATEQAERLGPAVSQVGGTSGSCRGSESQVRSHDELYEIPAFHGRILFDYGLCVGAEAGMIPDIMIAGILRGELEPKDVHSML